MLGWRDTSQPLRGPLTVVLSLLSLLSGVRLANAYKLDPDSKGNWSSDGCFWGKANAVD